MTNMRLGAVLTSALAGCVVTVAAHAQYAQTNLVSDIPGMAATTDPSLKNPWGIALGPTSPFWVSNEVTGVATIYDGHGAKLPLVVTVPGGHPTGQVFNGTSDFVLSNQSSALFMFATLNGSIAGWNPGLMTMAETKVPASGAVYSGLALANNGSGNFLYAANGAEGRIDVFNGSFQPTSLAGSFSDPTLPSGFTPYNIQNIGGTLYVTYENEDEGGGVINAFDANGNFLNRVTANEAGGPLKSPWGLALAPAGFGPFGNALLVGNEDDGRISAFDPSTGSFLGQLLDPNGDPIANTGLWGLVFGNGANGTSPNVLYFAAGINEEVHGLFGSIAVVPEPSTLWLAGFGGLMLVVVAKRRGSGQRKAS